MRSERSCASLTCSLQKMINSILPPGGRSLEQGTEAVAWLGCNFADGQRTGQDLTAFPALHGQIRGSRRQSPGGDLSNRYAEAKGLAALHIRQTERDTSDQIRIGDALPLTTDASVLVPYEHPHHVENTSTQPFGTYPSCSSSRYLPRRRSARGRCAWQAAPAPPAFKRRSSSAPPKRCSRTADMTCSSPRVTCSRSS